jgi:hypothetical protein
MRHYSLLLPQFWTGTTGKAITAAGKDARIVATYLLTCEHANMIGLYRLPLLYAAEETALKRREVAAALAHLKILEFAYYDEATEFVWVVEMARFQLSLSPGEAINDKDTRVKTVAALYKHLPTNPFLAPFFDQYAAILRLSCRRDFISEQKPHRSPIEGASVPHGRGTYSVPDSDSVGKGDTGETNQTVGDDGFEQFWEVYPRKAGKKDARQVWSKLKPDAALLATILAAIASQKQSLEWQKENGQFIPYPATWLNGRRWEDEGVTLSNGHRQVSACIARDYRPEDQRLHFCNEPTVQGSKYCIKHQHASKPALLEVGA